MKNDLTELNTTLEELSKVPDDAVTYKLVGHVMFRVEKPALVESLEDRKRTTEIALESYKKRLNTSMEKLQELGAKLQAEFAKLGIK